MDDIDDGTLEERFTVHAYFFDKTNKSKMFKTKEEALEFGKQYILNPRCIDSHFSITTEYIVV